MKTILFVISLLTFDSCEQYQKKSHNSDSHVAEIVKNLDSEILNGRLIGEWGIYSFSGFLCDVCPRIIFEDSSSATLTFPSGDNELYKWTTSETTLKLEFIGEQNSKHFFPNTEYILEFEDKEKYIELTLKLNETELYILRKLKND